MTRLGRGALVIPVALAAAALLAGPLSAQGEAVTLKYRYNPGRTVNAVMTMNGKLNMGISAGGQNLMLPMTMDMTMRMLQRVTGADPDGSGTVSQQVAGMTIEMNMAPPGAGNQKIVMRLSSGKLVMQVNGMEVPLPQQQGLDAKKMTEPAILKMDASGKVLSVKGGPAEFLGSLPGGSTAQLAGGPGGLALPANPVTVGATWPVKTTMKMPIASGQGGIAGTIDVEINGTNRLKSVETKNGRRIANIESEGKVTTGPGGAKLEGGLSLQAMNVGFKGVNQFDIEAGEPTSQIADINMDMKMGGAMGGQQFAMEMKGDFKAGTTYTAAR